MIRLFLFNNASRAANYGIGTYMRQLADGLSKCPYMEVSFVDLQSDVKEYLVEEDQDGHKHYKVPVLRAENERSSRDAFYFLARHLVAGENCDQLVFLFNYFHHSILALLLKSHYPGCRIILAVHYMGWCFSLKGNKQRFRQLMARNFQPQNDMERGCLQSISNERDFLHLADEVLALSMDTRQILLDYYGVEEEKIHLVYNGWKNELCTHGTEAAVTGQRIILFVGRLDEIKGLDYLIDAFKEIASKYPDTHLVVAGDGDFQTYLVQSRDVHDRISFMGKMSCEEVESLYQSAYIGVMPSFHEQCSYTAIEMMRHGIPLIGTDTTGLAEMLDATPELRVYINEEEKARDTSLSFQIAQRLDMLLSDKEAYIRASRAVAEQYKSRYMQSTMIDGIQWVVTSSFDRADYVVANDFLPVMDLKMVELIAKSPDIDIDFYGMAGIGVYLWMRVQESHTYTKYHLSKIQEYLIYYLEWVQEMVSDECLPSELIAMLQSMHEAGFYRTCVSELMHNQSAEKRIVDMPDRNITIQNALKICSCKI